MSKPSKGTVNVDIRDSVPDWEPFEPPKAPDGAPSVVYIVLDDVGFSAMSCYGGPIATPNLDKIAADGLLHAVAHDRPLLTHALLPPHRAQSHQEQHGPASPRPRSASRTRAARSRRRTARSGRSSTSWVGTRSPASSLSPARGSASAATAAPV
jgi:hypothetical protein